jgi:hypothetical protein
VRLGGNQIQALPQPSHHDPLNVGKLALDEPDPLEAGGRLQQYQDQDEHDLIFTSGQCRRV